MFIFKNKKNGFTLIELILTVFVVSVGLIAAYLVVQLPLYYTSLSVSRLTAAYLAKEGIEIVRNIRDTNWLYGKDWENGLSEPGGPWQADYLSTELSNPYDDNVFLNIDSDDFYGYSGSSPTKFKRKIEIKNSSDSSGTDILKVTVTVSWQERGKSYAFPPVETNLYQWWQ